jgi:dTDP-4-dehydrorhamnose 3,5-epimerase
MDIIETPLSGVMEIHRKPRLDSRGLFQRLFCDDLLGEYLGGRNIAQINHSLTHQIGTVRGMHMQLGAYAETKVISCISGEVYDVALDMRQNSPTFLQWHSINLSPSKHNSLLIPPGVAHGFQCLSENSELLYFHTEIYSADNEFGISINDARLRLGWPLRLSQISDRDLSFKHLSDDFLGFNL